MSRSFYLFFQRLVDITFSVCNMHCFGGVGSVVFDEDKDYEVDVSHTGVEEEKKDAVEAGAVAEEEDRVVDEGEEVAVVAVAPVVRESEEERVDDAYANDGNADSDIIVEDRLVDEAEEVVVAVADDDLVVREDGGRVDGAQRAEENNEEGREEDNAAGEEERVDDAYANDGNADSDIIVEDRLVDEAEEVAIAVADDDLVVREVGEQWAEENDEEEMEGREEIDVVSEEERVDDASADDEAASEVFSEEDRVEDEAEEVVDAVDLVVREAEGRVDAEQSSEENDEEGMEGKEEDSIASEENCVSVDEAAAAALAVRAEESSEEEDPAVQHDIVPFVSLLPAHQGKGPQACLLVFSEARAIVLFVTVSLFTTLCICVFLSAVEKKKWACESADTPDETCLCRAM